MRRPRRICDVRTAKGGAAPRGRLRRVGPRAEAARHAAREVTDAHEARDVRGQAAHGVGEATDRVGARSDAVRAHVERVDAGEEAAHRGTLLVTGLTPGRPPGAARRRPAPQGLRHCDTDTGKAWRHARTLWVADPFESVPLGTVPAAVGLLGGAEPLPGFVRAERALHLFGPEGGTLGGEMVARCPCRVWVPTRGCVGLAACVSVALDDCRARSGRWAAPAPIRRETGRDTAWPPRAG